MGLVEFVLIGLTVLFGYSTIIEIVKTYKEVKLAKINADTFKDDKK